MIVPEVKMMKEKFRQFMIGRYGTDALSKFMLITAIVFWVLNMIFDSRVLYSWAVVLLVLAYFRMFSKNIQKRYNENLKYLEIKNKVFVKFRKEKSNMEQRKSHRSECRQLTDGIGSMK